MSYDLFFRPRAGQPMPSTGELGAWFAQRYGWRATLAAIGLGSLAVAVLLRYWAREPLRGEPIAAAGGVATAPMEQGAVRAVLAEPVARWLIVAAALALLAGISFGTWNFAYLVRVHGLEPEAVGWITGLSALGSVLDNLASGALAGGIVLGERLGGTVIVVIGLGNPWPSGLQFPSALAIPRHLLAGLLGQHPKLHAEQGQPLHCSNVGQFLFGKIFQVRSDFTNGCHRAGFGHPPRLIDRQANLLTPCLGQRLGYRRATTWDASKVGRVSPCEFG